MIEIVSGTRLAENEFWETAALGLSLRRLRPDARITSHIFFSNTAALAEAYNARILARDAGDVVVFIHDDVWIDDLFIADHVMQGLAVYDVLGIAGNRRRVAGQPAWAFVDDTFKWDERVNLSGAVGHGPRPFGAISFYGPVPAECELLDGVFLAARRETLAKNSVLFDPRFGFHFYDMDFCRTARKRDLALGTWPIALTHKSGGAFGSAAWKEKREEYRRKWGS